jgi:predicted alpha/beta-fold hydrolase
LFVLPGTNGDELTSWYIHLACRYATSHYGYRVVVYVRRGCNLPMSNGRPQDYSDPMKPSGDMALAIERVRNRYPRSKMAAVGYSLGGNFLANYLGSRNKCDFVCGASVCGPYDITGLSYMLEFHYPMVDWYLRESKSSCLRSNRYVIESDEEAMRRGVNIDKIIAAKSFRAQCELDNLKVWGDAGESLNRYLDRCSCSNRVENIKIPTLFLASLDDPVSHDLFIPYEKLKSNPNCVLVTTER